MTRAAIRFLILDVDGVLTDGRLTLDREGKEPSKSFHVHDGAAIQRWRASGGEVAILSGRRSDTVAARAAELGIARVRQGVPADEKGTVLEGLLAETGIEALDACYIGDDLPDLPAMTRCGLAVAVSDAIPQVKRAAHYVTRRPGGHGAVAEVIDLLLQESPGARQA